MPTNFGVNHLGNPSALAHSMVQHSFIYAIKDGFQQVSAGGNSAFQLLGSSGDSVAKTRQLAEDIRVGTDVIDPNLSTADLEQHRPTTTNPET